MEWIVVERRLESPTRQCGVVADSTGPHGPRALWFNRGMGPKIQGFISGLFSTVCIDRLCQGESMMVTLSPGLKHQCTMEKSQQI